MIRRFVPYLASFSFTLAAAAPLSADVAVSTVALTYGTMTMPAGSSPATISYVVAGSSLPTELLNNLIAANPSIAGSLALLRDSGGANPGLPAFFTSPTRPEAVYATLVLKPAAALTDSQSAADIVRQAVLASVPGTGTGQTAAASTAQPAVYQRYVYPNISLGSGPGCGGGCFFDGQADVTLVRLDITVGNPTAGLTIPIVLSTTGLSGSFFTSELTLANRGAGTLAITYAYTAAFGGSSGTAPDSIGPGRQKIIPDTIAYLRSLGVPVGDAGNRGGTLRILFTGLSAPDAGQAVVRTTTAVPGGRAGLAYPGLPFSRLLTGPVAIAGLRQSDTDRSNVAVLNAGAPGDGDVTLRLTVVSGGADDAGASRTLPDVTLSPGGFYQASGVLATGGPVIPNGWVRVEKVAGTAPFYAYGVINDQANSDGSFIAPVPLTGSPLATLTLPIVVETTAFSTELVATNASGSTRDLICTYTAPQLFGGSVTFSIALPPGRQRIIPALVQTLRDQGYVVDGVGTFTGPLIVKAVEGDLRGIVIGGRTTTPGGGGRYGLFTAAVPAGAEATQRAYVYGLQQNGENRTNLAIVNTGSVDGTADIFRIDFYNGDNGLKSSVSNVVVSPKGFQQLNSVLSSYASLANNAWAVITLVSGVNPFIVYGVVNDGATPGERTGDGAYLPADVPGAP